MLANYRGIWEQDYAHLAPDKKVKKRDTFEERLYRRIQCLRAWWNNGLIKRARDEGNMYTASVFYKQIYPFLLHHRQFPNPTGV